MLEARVAQLFPLQDGSDFIDAAGEPAFQFGAPQELNLTRKAAVPRIRIHGDRVDGGQSDPRRFGQRGAQRLGHCGFGGAGNSFGD